MIKFNTQLFRAVVGKLQYITRVRPDMIFATTCLSYKLASPTLADLTRVKKVLRYLKGTRELNLYLNISVLRPNDLNKTLKHIKGYFDADWASDPVTRKTDGCPVENQNCMLLSAELIFAQAILKEIGLSFLIHSRQESSTARAVASKQRASRKMKHIHWRFSFVQDLVFRKLLTVSRIFCSLFIRSKAVKYNVCFCWNFVLPKSSSIWDGV